MQTPQLPSNERERLEAISEYKLLDTLSESEYDNITKLISTICDVPISLITILDRDRNFFKSHHGFPVNESPRDISFCGHAILDKSEIFIVKDARVDERFKNNPLVSEQKAIFYAGVPLINLDGYALGTLCVFDHEPRELTEHQIESLIILAKQVVNLFELRRQNYKLQAAKKELIKRNIQLKTFASHVSHDLKSPLSNIMSLTEFIKEEKSNKLTSESLEHLGYIEESATILKDYIDGILIYYQADELVKAKKEDVSLPLLVDELKHVLVSRHNELNYDGIDTVKNINRPALTQILINLIDNAQKYNDTLKSTILIAYREEPKFHKFIVTDNGIGIAKDKQELIFELFNTISRNGKPSTGIGLSTVKNLVNKLGGTISVTSELKKGSTFTFTIKK
ncbi:MAG: ATP-binding protein [Aquaticitalea sp.]